MVSFVASGHVVIFDAESRTPLQCFETTVGSTGTRQAHAAFPAPDGSYVLVANQNGKRLERIDTNFATNTFAHNPAATLDLATCTTPIGPAVRGSGPAADQLADLSDHRLQQHLRIRHAARRRDVRGQCEDHADVDRRRVRQDDRARQRLRRDRGGRAHVHQLGRQPGERVLDQSRIIPISMGSTSTSFRWPGIRHRLPPTPRRRCCCSARSGMSDSHGIGAAGQGRDRYLWVMDRHANVAEIINARTGRVGEHGGARRRDQRRPGARSRGSRTGRRSAVRRAARVGAAQRRSAQRQGHHARPGHHRGETAADAAAGWRRSCP